MKEQMTSLAWSAYKAILLWKIEGGENNEGEDSSDDGRDRIRDDAARRGEHG